MSRHAQRPWTKGPLFNVITDLVSRSLHASKPCLMLTMNNTCEVPCASEHLTSEVYEAACILGTGQIRLLGLSSPREPSE